MCEASPDIEIEEVTVNLISQGESVYKISSKV